VLVEVRLKVGDRGSDEAADNEYEYQ